MFERQGGSMHIIAPEMGMLGSAPIVGGTIPLALGAALATRIRKEKKVTVSFFGDGAAGEGILYESLNFAALKKLPIIFAWKTILLDPCPLKNTGPRIIFPK
jgi:pyruvate dehydrogenase E1 component alpha subunit